MQIQVFSDAQRLADAAAERIVAVVERTPDAVIGLATGSSPVAVYAAWGRLARERSIDQRGVRGFALDEYVGVAPDDPRSYHSVIRRDAVDPVGLDPARVRIPNGHDGERAAKHYEREIRDAGGVDLQVLGLGRNGHLGFNEPGSSADSRTRIVSLAAETRSDNARFFDDPADVPYRAITQGLGTIAEARELLVIVSGSTKARAVAAALEGPQTSEVPASLIREHPSVHWFLDDAAASLLQGAAAPATVR